MKTPILHKTVAFALLVAITAPWVAGCQSDEPVALADFRKHYYPPYSSTCEMDAPNGSRALDAQLLACALQDYYCHFAGQKEGDCTADVMTATMVLVPGEKVPRPMLVPQLLSQDDLAGYALTIMDQALLLDTKGINEFFLLLRGDYAANPEHREGIDRLLAALQVGRSDSAPADAVRERYRAEMLDRKQSSIAMTFLEDMSLVFAVAYGFRFTRGVGKGLKALWFSEGIQASDRIGLSMGFVKKSLEEQRVLQKIDKTKWLFRLEEFRFSNLKVDKIALRNTAIKLGIGAGVSTGHVLYNAFKEKRIDATSNFLTPVQDAIVAADAEIAVELRALIEEKLKLDNDAIKAQRKGLRLQIEEADRLITRLGKELGYLASPGVAPQLTRDMQVTIAADLTFSRDGVIKLQKSLEDIETADPDLRKSMPLPQAPERPDTSLSPECVTQQQDITEELFGAIQMTDPTIVAAIGANHEQIKKSLASMTVADKAEFEKARATEDSLAEFAMMLMAAPPMLPKLDKGKPIEPMARTVLGNFSPDYSSQPRLLNVSALAVLETPVTVQFRGKSIEITHAQVISLHKWGGAPGGIKGGKELKIGSKIVPSCQLSAAYQGLDPGSAIEPTVDGLDCTMFVKQQMTAQCGGPAK